ILDEPAAGLDPVGRRDILGGIRQYAGESGTTVIIVSHSMEDMAMYCDKLVVMANAKILMHKTCAEVFSEYQELIAVGLDVPQITRIASALAMNGADIGADIYTVDYAVKQLMKKL
ncbi:MAG: energy-coupling factor transporter ATPase, partial [Clostridia bacterium]|nr:energy-coupling factor transporter ATPase [Clostridia bacterium]